jgi:hypothetical protein
MVPHHLRRCTGIVNCDRVPHLNIGITSSSIGSMGSDGIVVRMVISLIIVVLVVLIVDLRLNNPFASKTCPLWHITVLPHVKNAFGGLRDT